jgi:hypothetical protein
MLLTAIADLGTRHATYKMQGRHDFAIGGHCFIYTVKLVIGQKFTPEVEESFIRMCICILTLVLLSFSLFLDIKFP